MNPEDVLVHYSPWIFFLYIIIKEGIPIIGRLADKWYPERMEQKKALDEKRMDIDEREVVALEQIGKALHIIENNQAHFRLALSDLDDTIKIIETNLSAVNAGLAVLMDRNIRFRRGDDVSITNEEFDNRASKLK